MTTPLTINVDHRDGGTLALVATGEIDLSNVRTFARALDDAIAGSSGKPVTVDLSAVDYLDSGGINVLFTNADHIHLIVKPLLMPVLTISGLTELATVEPAPPTD
ncbi:MAG: STAS domain-containing protein [Mycobacterium sp.]